jgi:outer membrane immunogenic protein
MKLITSALALAASALLATPALAQSETFTGPRAEVRVGFDNVNLDTSRGRVDADGVTYGAALGYDVALAPRVVTGVTLGIDGSSADGKIGSATSVNAKRDLNATARLGYVLGDSVLVYGQAGYSNQRYGFRNGTTTAEGLRYGGGVEVAVSKNAFVKGDYIVSDYDDNLKAHKGLVSVGLRFK